MMNWLRRLIATFERRWIRDPAEREEHEVKVRRRLNGEPADDEPVSEPRG